MYLGTHRRHLKFSKFHTDIEIKRLNGKIILRFSSSGRRLGLQNNFTEEFQETFQPK